MPDAGSRAALVCGILINCVFARFRLDALDAFIGSVLLVYPAARHPRTTTCELSCATRRSDHGIDPGTSRKAGFAKFATADRLHQSNIATLMASFSTRQETAA